MKRRLLLSLAPVVVLMGCATPYQTRDHLLVGGGYSDQKVSNNAYVVEFRGNGKTPEPTVWGFWLYRCAELTLEKGFAVFQVQRRDAGQTAPMTQGMSNGSGGSEHAGGEAPREPTAFIYVPGGTYTYTTYQAAAVVHMYALAQVPSNIQVLDARRVMSALGPFVRSQGQLALPDRPSLLKSSMVAGLAAPYDTGSVRMEDLQKLLPRK